MKNYPEEKKSDLSHSTSLKTSKRDLKIKGGTIRFQIGLLVALVMCYLLIETAFAIPDVNSTTNVSMLEEDEVYVMPAFEIERVKEVTKKNDLSKISKLIDEVEVVEDDAVVDVKEEFFNNVDDKVEISVDDIVDVEPVEDIGPISINSVQYVPVYPGCEALTTNIERRDCMSDKINRIVKKNFDASIASDYGLSGTLRIDVQFKINKQGEVSDVKVRAPHKSLEREAARVTALIPQMKPGRQGDQEVDVIFLKPIIFKVQ
ncbi:energy transducer TonB [Joostella sp. CR20]|uniref:energy transducer TonB n=1 Tax=Joostella sp. CR20 TaxID=2804312 RepID=UPI00313EF14D